MQILVIHTAIYFSFYIIGAYATTDILRLLKGCDVSVNDKDCYCPICHSRIALRDQLPIAAYIINKGQCRNCRSHIPIKDIFFEIFLFLAMSFTAKVLDFRMLSYICCLLIYEGAKLTCIIIFGRREQDFTKNLVRSLCNNLIIFIFVFILFVMERWIAPIA